MPTGQIISYASAAHAGVIKAPNGPRYLFDLSDGDGGGEPLAGEVVEFDDERRQAKHVRRAAQSGLNPEIRKFVGLG